jgi:Family of unknown function (DUF6152)
MKKILLGALAAVTLAAIPLSVASAHHSPVAVFDMQDRSNWEGTLKEVHWVNPHIYIVVDVKGADGKVTPWQFESMPVVYFTRAGVRKKDFDAKIGDKVKVRAMKALNGKPLGFLRIVTFSDGSHYTILKDTDATPLR